MTEDAVELEALRSSIRRVLTEHASREHIQRYVKSTELYDQALWGEAAKLGWLALSVPEDDGGLGLGMNGAAILYEELGRSLAPVPVLGSLLLPGRWPRPARPHRRRHGCPISSPVLHQPRCK